MAFPFTHLSVGFELLKHLSFSENDSALFLLGTIAPDAVHYREDFVGSNMNKIGPAKKVTHLCPISGERWGAVTDNDGWAARVFEFLYDSPQDPLSKGYAVHVLTDIQNNVTIWEKFRTGFPEEAAKGYGSDYYADLDKIDMELYKSLPYTQKAMDLLSRAVSSGDLYWKNELLVTLSELRAIQHNLVYEHFINAEISAALAHIYKFITYRDKLEFIDRTVEAIWSQIK